MAMQLNRNVHRIDAWFRVRVSRNWELEVRIGVRDCWRPSGAGRSEQVGDSSECLLRLKANDLPLGNR